MGNKHSIEDDLITFRMTSKQLARSAAKCEKAQQTQKLKAKQAIEQGNLEGAKIFAQNAIREKNNHLNFLKLQARIDAVASRLDTVLRMKDVSAAMGQSVKGMANAMKTMNIEQIASTMDTFEKQFENFDVTASYMEGAMDSTTALSTPPEQVDGLLQQIADEYGLQATLQLDQTAMVNETEFKNKQADAPKQKDDLESRLAKLRNA